MQHRYFGDVGDFGKYGLLRALCGLNGEPRLSLGVVWYLFPDESHNADGKHLGYLRRNDATFRECDALLYDKLRDLLYDEAGEPIGGARHVSSAEAPDLLPEGTIFYAETLSFDAADASVERLARRRRWYEGALAFTQSSDIVFLDPDNGIECATARRTGRKGPKYVFWDEIEGLVGRGQTAVIYHHLNRNAEHPVQVTQMLAQLKDRVPAGRDFFALIYRRGTARAYFIIADARHAALVGDRLERFQAGAWRRHFGFQ